MHSLPVCLISKWNSSARVKIGDVSETLLIDYCKRFRGIIEERRKAYQDAAWADSSDVFPPYIGLFYSVVSGVVGAQCVLQLKEMCAFFKASRRKKTSTKMQLATFDY